MPSGNDDEFNIRVKFSLVSTMLSFIIGMFKCAIVVLAGNVTMCGPIS